MAITMAALQKQWKQSDADIRKSIRMILAASEMTYEDLGRLMGLSVETIGRRMKTPSNISVREWRVIEHLADTYGVNIVTI